MQSPSKIVKVEILQVFEELLQIVEVGRASTMQTPAKLGYLQMPALASFCGVLIALRSTIRTWRLLVANNSRRTASARCGSHEPHMKISTAAKFNSGQVWIEM
jgi:hypothetical protein